MSDAAQVRRQLAGEALSLADIAALRDDVSTDEIIPLPAMVHFDATLGRYPLTGYTAGGERPIGVDAIRRAGIEVIVAGARYGKGSSREHAVVAERSAGVRLVIACIRRGEAISLDELLAGRDRACRRPARSRRGAPDWRPPGRCG
ncbi:hypothetical protein [Leptothrix cholodnii]|uniref:hypothetical protein n=1 Tax=Leptothrix cholodnii TaxID=34029 RepID=UPI0002DE2927